MRATVSIKYACTLVIAAFLIRAIVMLCLIQPYNFYHQADSTDYHNCAVSIASGNGMHRIDTKEPIFWRTPGYPPYLAFFYHLYGLKSWRFEDNAAAHQLSLWIQIILSSFIPLILFYLALTITHASLIAHILAWIAVFHIGLILASTYLLTEGLALIFFYLFLLLLYRSLVPQKIPPSVTTIIAAALCLGIYTWMRPMGEFIGYFSALLLVCASVGSWKKKVGRGALFFLLFFASLFPWYLRNYNLTGEWFFCPTIGTYLNCFSVPKILRRTLNKPIEECHKIAQMAAARELRAERIKLHGTGKHISNNICKKTAYPIVQTHPWFFLYDWIGETIKTALDLYSYQCVQMINDSYWYDPIEEYLPEKITACLWTSALPWHGRAIAWAECIFALLLWIGLFCGLWIFIIRPIINKKKVSSFVRAMQKVWLITIPLIGIIIGMTGGFGYARLRLPAEPLMIILSLTFWYWFYYRTQDIPILKEKR